MKLKQVFDLLWFILPPLCGADALQLIQRLCTFTFLSAVKLSVKPVREQLTGQNGEGAVWIISLIIYFHLDATFSCVFVRLTFVLLSASLLSFSRPASVSFLSHCPLDTSNQQDWCYLNEDGELGLAYQGLKQVARSSSSSSTFLKFLFF